MGPASGPRAATRTASPAKRHLDAACCLVDDLPLATLNVKDFADFAEHEGLILIGGQEP
jgi:predicted nucleic acid-binding protein